MSNLHNDKTQCCGCSACISVCPKPGVALQMLPDEEGFLYPHINEEACLHCNKCREVCIYKNGYSQLSDGLKEHNICAAQLKDKEILQRSQSGGLFSALAQTVLKNNGVVCGAMLVSKDKVIHDCIASEDKLYLLNGSKYIQSDMGSIFVQVKHFLNQNIQVLFSGTPCQVAGLRKYLGAKEYENLTLVDIICYGVPSPVIWRSLLKYFERKYTGEVQNVIFRDKAFGWESAWSSLWINDMKISTDIFYPKLFVKNVMFRPSCYNCLFTNMQRPSDITIGDCWGIPPTKLPDVDHNNGVSMAIVNTVKGKNLVQSLESKCFFDKVEISDVIQPRLNNLVRLDSSLRRAFWNDFNKYPFEIIIKKYATDSCYIRLKRIMRENIKKVYFVNSMWKFYKRLKGIYYDKENKNAD